MNKALISQCCPQILEKDCQTQNPRSGNSASPQSSTIPVLDLWSPLLFRNGCGTAWPLSNSDTVHVIVTEHLVFQPLPFLLVCGRRILFWRFFASNAAPSPSIRLRVACGLLCHSEFSCNTKRGCGIRDQFRLQMRCRNQTHQNMERMQVGKRSQLQKGSEGCIQ